MGWNNAGTYSASSIEDLRETIGIPQFSGATSENWAFVFNGLIFQGGTITVPGAVTVFDFHAPFTQQVLGIFIQPQTKGHAPGVVVDLNTFTVDHSGSTDEMYWYAIGV
jgi:hypothetical protein